MGRQRDRDRGVRAGQLHHGERIADRVGAGTAVGLGKRQPEQTQLRHLRDDCVREFRVPIELLGARRDFFACKLPAQIRNRFLLGGQIEVHRRRYN